MRRIQLLAGAVAVAALVLAGVLWQRRRAATVSTVSPTAVRVAVLPFDNLGDSADGYFADGLTDAVRAKLVALPGLEIIAPTSSDQYRHTRKSARQIGQELGVRYLVMGRVRWNKVSAQGRVQIDPALIEAETAADKWEQAFDAPLTDVFEMQGDIAAKIAGALGIALGASQQRALAAAPTQNLAAYNDYLRGVDLERGGQAIDGPALRRAMGHYAEAIALDSNFAPALAALAWGYSQLQIIATGRELLRDSATYYASRALRIDSTLAEAHAARAASLDRGSTRESILRAAEEARTGLRLAPGSALALTVVARYEQATGNWSDALIHWQQAVRLDPRAVVPQTRLAFWFLLQRRFPEAKIALDHAAALNPTSIGVLEGKIFLALMQGEISAARDALHTAPRGVQRQALIIYLTNEEDLYWLLDKEEQQYLVGSSAAEFADDTASWLLTVADQYSYRGDSANARRMATRAIDAYAASIAVDSSIPSLAFLATALAHDGRREEAMRLAALVMGRNPLAISADPGARWQFEVVRAYLLLGQNEKALDALEPLLRVPSFLTPAWLRIDPTFAPLRGTARFERLASGR